MIDKRIIDKIHKCLALGKSSNEHEAAAAMRQAQKLMEMHDISEREVELSVIVQGEGIVLPVQASMKVVPEYLTNFLWLVEYTFGVRAGIARELSKTDYHYVIYYMGRAGRVQAAMYAHKVIWRQMQMSWEVYRNGFSMGRGARTSYFLGYLTRIGREVTKYKMDEADEQLLDEYVKKTCTGKNNKTNEMQNDPHIMADAMEDAANFRFGLGVVGGQETKLLEQS